MNCRPGDLAVVVRTHVGRVQWLPIELLGVFVTVETISELVGDNEVLWQLQAPVQWVAERHYVGGGKLLRPGDWALMARMPDSVLQPIRGLPNLKREPVVRRDESEKLS